MENRNGLVVDIDLTQATGGQSGKRRCACWTACRERTAAHNAGRRTRATTRRSSSAELRQRKVTPHVTQNQSGRRSAIDGRTTSHGGYKVSQRLRKRVEEIFGWTKTSGGGDKLRYIGLARNQLWAELTAAGYNLVRMVRIERQQAQAPA